MVFWGFETISSWLQVEIRRKSNELEATAAELLTAHKHIVDAGNDIAQLQSLLGRREKQQQALEQKIRELESEALGSISTSHKDRLDERIEELEQELELISQEKASHICIQGAALPQGKAGQLCLFTPWYLLLYRRIFFPIWLKIPLLCFIEAPECHVQWMANNQEIFFDVRIGKEW